MMLCPAVLLLLLLLAGAPVGVTAGPLFGGLGNISKPIVENGYPLEVHEATTRDGYVLQLLRIPHGRGQRAGASKGAVVLMHGLSSCAADWFLNLPHQSLGYILADEGYDVWVGNARGNGYSMKHTGGITPADAAFWNFTWDSMASDDLPTTIDYVLAHTGRAKLTAYFGISQGTAMAWAGFSNNHALALKVELFVAFAPVARVFHQRSKLMSALAAVDGAVLVEALGAREWDLPSAIRYFLPGLCEADPTACENAIAVEVGPSVNMNASRLPFFLEYEMAPTSIFNMIHWAQEVRHDAFQHMNWNFHSGLPGLPYDLTKFPESLPVALFTGGEDYLADATDVAWLVSQLPRKPISTVFEPTYSHIDYVISDKAYLQIYPTVLKLLANAGRE